MWLNGLRGNVTMNKDWSKTENYKNFIDISIFEANYFGHAYWYQHKNGCLEYILHFNQEDALPIELCKVSPEEAGELRAISEKYQWNPDGYWAVWRWANGRDKQ